MSRAPDALRVLKSFVHGAISDLACRLASSTTQEHKHASPSGNQGVPYCCTVILCMRGMQHAARPPKRSATIADHSVATSQARGLQGYSAKLQPSKYYLLTAAGSNPTFATFTRHQSSFVCSVRPALQQTMQQQLILLASSSHSPALNCQTVGSLQFHV